MQQSEILSLTERLIPVYGQDDFDFVLGQLTEESSPSTKMLVKMELHRLMAPCSKSVDLRGRVDSECRNYLLDGLSHWLDDVAFNAYHKYLIKFGRYTEGMWEALIRGHYRASATRSDNPHGEHLVTTDPNSAFLAEPIHLGYNLKRQEKRLKVHSQVEIVRQSKHKIHGLSMDLSCSGAKFKVPGAFKYNLGEVIQVTFSELASKSQLTDVDMPISYRVLAVDDSLESDAVRYLRAIRLTETNLISRMIDEALGNAAKRAQHDNQDKIVHARTRGYEHITLKHTNNLPLFFAGNELKVALLTPNNQKLWQYWHDERNQQVLGSLFNPQRMSSLIRPGLKSTTNVLYAFTHEHESKTYFYSLLRPEASREQRQLFWHFGAKKPSWRAFRLSIAELTEQEKSDLTAHATELMEDASELTHVAILQEIADPQSAQDYLLTEKPRLPANTLNVFRHPRKIIGKPKGIYFDAISRRKESRYRFKTPVELSLQEINAPGSTADISKRGLNVILNEPTALRTGQSVSVNFRELQLYDKQLPLSAVPYTVVRVSPDGREVQLVIEEFSKTMRVIGFFNRIIEHNQDKLIQQKTVLPNTAFLAQLHHILLSHTTSSSVFIAKSAASAVKTPVIGLSFPLAKPIDLFARLGHSQLFSLEPLFKGHSKTLIAEPIRRIDGAQTRSHDVYLSVARFDNKITAVESKLAQDFVSVKERIQFIKRARMQGEFYAIRIATAPIFDPITHLLQQELSELSRLSRHQASKLEKELTALVGYSEFDDISEEVIVRLERSE